MYMYMYVYVYVCMYVCMYMYILYVYICMQITDLFSMTAFLPTGTPSRTHLTKTNSEYHTILCSVRMIESFMCVNIL